MSPHRSADDWAGLVGTCLEAPTETEWVEFKVNNGDPQAIGEYLSALSNAAALNDVPYAYLIWGITDGDHQVVGTTFDPNKAKKGNESLENWLSHNLTPSRHFSFTHCKIDDRPIVILEIEAAIHQPTSFRGQEYTRVGPHKKSLHSDVERERRLWRSFERTPFEYRFSMDGLAEDKVLELLDFPSYFELHSKPLPATRRLLMYKLAEGRLIHREPTGKWSVTNLGAILYAKKLSSFDNLSHKAARVIVYQGNSRATTSVKEQEGAKGYASGFTGLIQYVNQLLPSNEVMGQAIRRTVQMYPELAVRELIANALVHQDFSITGAGPMVEVFNNRLEITNPGTPLINPQRFIDADPKSRNEKIARSMKDCGICEERGSGWDKVGFEIEFHQLPAPLITTDLESTKITMFAHRPLTKMDKDERIRAVYLHACLRHVSGERVTNPTVRERFGIDAKNSAVASRLISEAVTSGLIAPYDKSAGRKLMSYVPFWAA